jgi:hypothetical protein
MRNTSLPVHALRVSAILAGIPHGPLGWIVVIACIVASLPGFGRQVISLLWDWRDYRDSGRPALRPEDDGKEAR